MELLSVEESGIDQIPMSPEGRKDKIKEALKRIVIQGAEIRPLILAFEDLHWMDQSSEDVLKDLLNSISGARVFLLFTYRPEFVYTWGARSYHNQVNLNRLSNREGIVMASYHLGTAELDRDLENLILEKTEGIPFFIEEFLKSLIELEIIQRKGHKWCLRKEISTVTIPSTIQDVISTRVDALDEGAKKVLQAGSVIEREFTYELIKKVTGMPDDELLSHLSILKNSELLHERGIYPKSTYIFKHALTREVIYDSILTKRKKDLHAIAGNAIENVYKDNISEHYGVLVKHFIESEDFEKGAEYSKLVSKKAAKMASLNVAIVYAKKRVESLENLDRTDDVIKNIINARTALGLYTSQYGYLEEAKEAIDPIMDLTLRHGNKRRLSQIYIIDGTYSYMIEENFQKAFKCLKEGLKLSEKISEVISTVLANYYLGVAFTFNCEFEKAFYHIEKAYSINETVNNLWGMSVMKSHLSLPCNYQGQVHLGHQHSEKAVQLAEESGDIFSKAMAYTLHGISCYYKGSFADAIQHLLMGADFGEKINYFAWNAVSQFYLGESHFEIGEYQNARNYYEKAIWFLENNIWLPSFMNLNKIAFSLAKIMNDEKNVNIESLRGAATKNKLMRFDGQMQRYIGEILLNIDDGHIPDSEDWIKNAIKTDKNNGVRFELGKSYVLYAELFKRKGDQSKAKENLSKAIGIFKACGADGWVAKYEKDLVQFINQRIESRNTVGSI